MDLKAGDRVAVYGGGLYPDDAWIVGVKGKIIAKHTAGVRVKLVTGKEVIVHPKQCRRMVKKQGFRIWLPRHQLASFTGATLSLRMDASLTKILEDDIEFVEVKKK